MRCLAVVILVFVGCTPPPDPVTAPTPSEKVDADAADAGHVPTVAKVEASDAKDASDASHASAATDVVTIDAPVAVADVASVADVKDAAVAPKDAGVAPKKPSAFAQAGEVCEEVGQLGVSEKSKPCAPGLVCCRPPHGAPMPIEYSYCQVPCKKTAPKGGAQFGCSDGCPWANLP